MRKKIKDITIQDMINICNSHKHESCLNCQLFRTCSYTPQELIIREDIEKEIDL